MNRHSSPPRVPPQTLCKPGLTVAFLVAGLAVSGCASTVYIPQVTARGEITLRYNHAFEMWAGGQRIASGVEYGGLRDYVKCVPEAEGHAASAQRAGTAAVVLSALGASFGIVSVGGLVGLGVDPNPDHLGLWLGGGVGVATAGTVMAGLSRLFKNQANGHAVDATNYYNDAVGSFGATCDDLRYPLPVAPAPAPALAPTAAPAPAPTAAPISVEAPAPFVSP
jgi:hypothetical protein